MSTPIEQISALERRFSMAIPMSAVETETEARIRKIARTVKMPGFRPGKVPLKMVAAQYGPQVRYEVIGDQVNQAFSAVVSEHQLRVAGQPRIEPKNEGDPQSFHFTATFEVFPDIQFPALDSISVERPVVEITDADVDRTLETLRKQRVRYEPKDGTSAEGDRVIVDFEGAIDGAAFQGGSAKDFAIVLGEKRMLPEFEANLLGLSKGDRRTFAVNFPEDYFGREVAGKTAQFTVTVKQVDRGLLPEVDAEFARAFGIADGELATLRTEVKANLELERKRRVFQAVREQVFKALRAAVPVNIPASLVQAEAQRMARVAREDLIRRGVKPENAAVSPSTFEPAATERVAMGLILGELVRQHGLDPKPEQIRALVEEQAQSYESPEQVIAWHYQDPRRLGEFEAQALEHNVVTFILAKAKVTDKPMTFLELIGSQAA